MGVYTQDATTPANTTSHYLHKDHLGSVVKVTDSDGLVTVAEYSYDVWGKPRNAATWADDLTAWPDHETDRGFTGHEMLAGVELVHMNGRIYDPLLGRFLSADPFVQSPDNLQSYNRYSYVLNNPISFTDPSGFFFKKLFRAIGNFFKRLVIAIVASVLYAINPYLAYAFLAYVGYKSNGIQGAIFAVLTYNSAPGGGGGGGPGGVVILNITGENNRNRSYGFYLKAIQLVAQIVFQKDEKRISVAPRIGGTKFYNGAATGSFAHNYNKKVSTSKAKKLPEGTRELTPEERIKLQEAINEVRKRGFTDIADGMQKRLDGGYVVVNKRFPDSLLGQVKLSDPEYIQLNSDLFGEGNLDAKSFSKLGNTFVHEYIHIEQLIYAEENIGLFGKSATTAVNTLIGFKRGGYKLKNIYQNIYRNNPLEIDARNVADNIFPLSK